MSTLKQIEANRLNAQRSTGPRSAEGKAVSSMNALKTGIDAQSEVIRGEDPAALETLTTEYTQRFQPETPEERDLVDTLVASTWQLRRFRKLDALIWEAQFRSYDKYGYKEGNLGEAFATNSATFARLQRRVEVTTRIYNATLDKLKALRKSRRDDEPQAASESAPVSSSADAGAPVQPEQSASVNPELGSFRQPPDPGPLPSAA